ncbi:MAG TPA: GNAT family N-acetyltransferase [Jatrophihabitans sp.]|nr:GNAT family N-acetyltransferase [Jatrophihabitans sp.]
MGQFRGVDLDDLELVGDRLVLRPWQSDDAARVHKAMQDQRMHQFLALPNPYTAVDARRFVTEIATIPRADGTGLDCALIERGTGRVVGSASLRLGGDPEIGYWVAPDAQGHGFAAEASRVLAEWAFELDMPRVRLACDVRNLASARTALAAGFRFEGVTRNGVTSPGGGWVPERRGDLARFARLPADPTCRVPYAFAPFPEEGLTDGVLRLRVMEADDAATLSETDDDLTVKWGFTGQPSPPDDVRRNAARAGLDWLVGTTASLSMVDVATGAVAGSLRLRKPGPPQVGGIGYVVHPAFRGRGYTTRALRLLAPWAFDVADFARLELGAKVGNDASLRAAAAAGFEPDGVRRRRLRNPDGSFSDEVRYALINPRYA